ncbi:hypothetical protein Tco_1570030 [Tanacetum coccineum]
MVTCHKLQQGIHAELLAYRAQVQTHETHIQIQDTRIRSLETLIATLVAQTSSLQAQLTTALGRIQTLEAREPAHTDDLEDAGSSSISFDESDDEDCTISFDKKSFSYKIISVNDLKTDLENDIDKVNMPLLPSPEPTVSYFDDLDYFKDFDKEFPAIVYNDALTSKSDFLTEPTHMYLAEKQIVQLFRREESIDLEISKCSNLEITRRLLNTILLITSKCDMVQQRTRTSMKLPILMTSSVVFDFKSTLQHESSL